MPAWVTGDADQPQQVARAEPETAASSAELQGHRAGIGCLAQAARSPWHPLSATALQAKQISSWASRCDPSRGAFQWGLAALTLGCECSRAKQSRAPRVQSGQDQGQARLSGWWEFLIMQQHTWVWCCRS